LYFLSNKMEDDYDVFNDIWKELSVELSVISKINS
jgi:hypothetical protein